MMEARRHVQPGVQRMVHHYSICYKKKKSSRDRDLREEHEVVGDKDERGKALSVNVERGAGIFCKIVIVCFLFVRYRSDGLYYKMAGTPSSPTHFSLLLLL